MEQTSGSDLETQLKARKDNKTCAKVIDSESRKITFKNGLKPELNCIEVSLLVAGATKLMSHTARKDTDENLETNIFRVVIVGCVG